MSGTTPIEGLPYPCIADPMQRHWIQDLATAADLSLNRASSDIDLIEHKPRTQLRRTTGTQAVASGAAVPITFTSSDYDTPTPGWGNIALGVTPNIPGLYYVDLSVTAPPPEGDAMLFDIQYNGVTKLGRKFLSLGGGPAKLSGIILCNDFDKLIRARIQLISVGAIATTVTQARLAVQFMTRCSAPLNSNPWMERTITPWTGTSAAVALSTVQKWRGNSSLLATPSGTTPEVVSEIFDIPAASVNYATSAWVRSTTTQNMDIQVRWYTAASVFISSSTTASTSVPATTWTKIFGIVAAPATAAKASIAIRRTGAGTGPTYYVDDAMLMRSC